MKSQVRFAATPSSFSANGLPSIPVASKNFLPSCSAIYFLIGKTGKILYVGQTQNLKSRWASHNKKPHFSVPFGSRIHWIPADSISTKNEILCLERDLITHFKPPMNKAIGSGIPINIKSFDGHVLVSFEHTKKTLSLAKRLGVLYEKDAKKRLYGTESIIAWHAKGLGVDKSIVKGIIKEKFYPYHKPFIKAIERWLELKEA